MRLTTKIWVALFTWVSLVNVAVAADDYLTDPLDSYTLPTFYFNDDAKEIASDFPNNATTQEAIIQPGFSVYSWNVGGGSGIASTFVRNQIIAMNPDILLLCEVGTQTSVNNLVSYLNTQLNTTYYVYYQEAGNSTYPLVFLSKYPYQSTQTIVNSQMQKALLKVVIEINNEDYTFYGLHAVTASNKTFHENEAKRFLTEIQLGLRTMVLGDFNSRSRLDGAVHSLTDPTYSTQGWAYPNTVSTDLFTAAGWVDTWRYQYPDAAVTATKLTKRGTTNSGSNLGERIDYIWASPDLTNSILAAEINTETTNYLSDHKPVWVRIDAGEPITTLGGRNLDNTPTIARSSLAANNRYLDITFTEGVYRDINASQPLTVDNFEISFDPHITGSASGATISSVKQPDSEDEVAASPLIGGEVTVRLFLNIIGIPNGNETIKVHLAGENASAQDNNKPPAHIYNSAGIADHWTYVNTNQVGIASCIRTNYHHLNIKSLSVTFIAQPGGTINGNTQVQQNVTYGSATTPVTAIPENGYYFVNWTKAEQEYSTNPILVIDSVTEDVVFTAHFAQSIAPNLLLDGDFTLSPNLKNTVYQTEVNQGWYKAKISRWDWDANNQWVFVNQADKSAGISQVISGTGIQGTLNVAFWGLNQAIDTITNTLQLQVLGINGQFKLANGSTFRPQAYNQDPTFSYTMLFNKKFTYEEDFTWIPFQASFPVTNEYQYLVLRFVVNGVNPLAGEMLAIDKVKLSIQSTTLPGIRTLNEDFSEPLTWLGDEISPSQADLGWYVAKNSRWTWDNTNYWVYVKQKYGGGGLVQILSTTGFKGTVNLDLRLLNQEADNISNRLQIQVFGINDPFKLSFWQSTPPHADSGSTLDYTLLLNDTLSNGQSFDWTALSTQFEVTHDYKYLAIRIFVTGVKPKAGDILALDDFKIN